MLFQRPVEKASPTTEKTGEVMMDWNGMGFGMGFGLIVWLLILVFLVLGIAALAKYLRK